MICICKHCGKEYIKRNLTATCSECLSVDKMILEQINAYLKHYPNSNAMQISEGLGISAFKILKYVDEGRLSMRTGAFEKI